MPSILLQRSLLAMILTAILTGFSSYLMAISRIIMLGLALLHTVLAGGLIGIFITYNYNIPLPVTTISIIITAIVSLIASEIIEHGLSIDSTIGIIAAISTSLTVTFAYLDSLISPIAVSTAWSYVMGLSTLFSFKDILTLLLINLIVIPVVMVFKTELIYIAFDEDGARALGLRVRLYRALLFVLCGIISSTLAITLGVFVAHVVLVAPGVSIMKLMSKRVSMFHSVLLSLVIALVGYIIAYGAHLPPSSGIGIVATGFLLVAQLKTQRS